MQHLTPNSLLQGGKYKIVRFISAGGFGCTYEGVHTMMDTRVAIKEFFPKMFCNRDEDTSHITIATQSNSELVSKLRRKFIDEAKAIFKMNHSNIVKVHDIFEDNGTAYYVMDYVDGNSLSDIIKDHGTLSEAEAVGYIRQVADALKYVHSLNRLHLDIKPGNIMVDGKGNAILIDFGASKHYDMESGENTSTLMGVNTKGYAPVEQSTQSFTKFSPATDIYALGATLYKLLTGITPPDANLLVAKEEALDPLPVGISVSTRNTVMKAMSLIRADRPQSVDEFLAILNAQPNADDEETTIVEAANQTEEARDVTKYNRKQSKEENDQEDSLQPPELLEKEKSKNKTKGVRFVIGCLVVALFMIGGVYFMGNGYFVHVTGAGTNLENGHGWVDLGLSVKWATCNVGANAPEEYGEYYAWGETTTKNVYSESNYTYSDNPTTLPLDKDAAHVNWGGSWRMPTTVEQYELQKNCNVTWTTMNGVEGYIVTSKKNGNSIFLPAAGYGFYGGLRLAGSYGSYWSSTLSKGYSGNAYGLYFNSGNWDRHSDRRDCGHSVRAVCP